MLLQKTTAVVKLTLLQTGQVDAKRTRSAYAHRNLVVPGVDVRIVGSAVFITPKEINLWVFTTGIGYRTGQGRDIRRVGIHGIVYAVSADGP